MDFVPNGAGNLLYRGSALLLPLIFSAQQRWSDGIAIVPYLPWHRGTRISIHHGSHTVPHWSRMQHIAYTRFLERLLSTQDPDLRLLYWIRGVSWLYRTSLYNFVLNVLSRVDHPKHINNDQPRITTG